MSVKQNIIKRDKRRFRKKPIMKFDELIENVTQWADDKNILKPENSTKQMLKNCNHKHLEIDKDMPTYTFKT